MRKKGHNDSPFLKYSDNQQWIIDRRTFLKVASTSFLGLLYTPIQSIKQIKNPSLVLRFGIVTDIHYADTGKKGTRYYRESISKLTECVKLMNTQNVEFLIELGDFKDQNNSPSELISIKYLQTIESVFQKFNGPTYHVLGNHDLDSISKSQFLTNVKNTGIPFNRGYYSFDFKGIHFVVLDANYKADGLDYDHGNYDWTDCNIPQKELDWLKRELTVSVLPSIVFVHQLLDGEGSVYIKNAKEVRKILEDSSKVLAIFQGHHHEGKYSHIAGIGYYTLIAMVEGSGLENNSFAIVDIYSDNSIAIKGYFKAVSKQLF